jgi:hypothetical protein
MTDTTEPAREDQSTAATPTDQASSLPVDRRRSAWSRLNRTNRIAALVLGGVAAVFVAALIFGAGLLVGAEYGDSEGHHDGAGSSEYADGEGTSGEGQGADGESGDKGDGPGSDDQSTRGESDQPRSGSPDEQAPRQTTGAPRP